MKYLKKTRTVRLKKSFEAQDSDNNPLTGVANLFDIGVVFIAGLIVTLFSAYRLQELFDQKSEITIMKQSKDGEMEIIAKKGKKIKALKVSKEKAQGRGERLGTAYKLADGTMVYVPDE